MRGDEELNKELSRYRGEKGNLRLPLDEPIPYKLISNFVKFKVKEHVAKVRSTYRSPRVVNIIHWHAKLKWPKPLNR